MTDDRDRALAAVSARLAEAQATEDPRPLFGAEADAEVRALLLACDPTRDMAARWAAGWLFFGRATALPPGRGGEPGAVAGTLLFPVWVADPSAVPEPLANWFAAAPRHAWPDPAGADGPAEWAASSIAGVIAAEGRQHTPPRGASEATLRLHALAAEFAASGLGPEMLLHSAVGGGILAHLGTPDHDLAYPIRVLEYALAALDRYRGVPGAPAPGDAPLPDDRETREIALLLARETLEGAPHAPNAPNGGDRLEALSALVVRLIDRYLVERRPEDLTEGIRVGRELLDLLPAGHPLLAREQCTLGRLLLMRLEEEAGAPAEYDEAVDLLRRAVPGAPSGPGTARRDLATALLLRYSRTALRRDLDEAVGVLGEALAGPWPDAEPRVEALVTLGNALRLRFQVTGDRADLDAALRHLTEVIAAAGEVTSDTVQRLHVPALLLFNRYGLTGDARDLDQALTLLRRAVALLPSGHPMRPSVLNHLGLVLIEGGQRTGTAEELAEAMTALRESVDTTHETHPQLAARLINLSNALIARYHATGDTADLQESLRCRRRAAALPTLGRRDRTAVLSATGLALVHRTERSGGGPVTASDEAIELLREAIRLTPPEDPMLPNRRINLAVALSERQHVAYDIAELREARAQVDAALAALPDDAPMFPNALVVAAGIRLSSLTVQWSRRAQDEAIALVRRAVAATPPGHVRRTSRLTFLADAMRHRHGGRLRGPAARDRRAALVEAAGLYREAALEERCAASERLTAARQWGETWAALGAWDLALEGLSCAVDLLPRVAPRQLVGDDQEVLLSDAAGLGSAAAACAVRCGRPGLAVRLLEQARGVLLSHAFDADSDLTRLRAVAPELAHRFETLRDALDSARHGPEFPEQEAGEEEGGRFASADPRHQLAAEWRTLVGTIRAEHPGLGMFRPVGEWDESELRATSAEGPVVLVNVSPFGSHALVVTPHAVEAVSLPGLDPSTLAKHGTSFLDALGRLDAPRTSRPDSLRAQQEVRDTLAWLWRRIVGPVLDHLGVLASPNGPWPRLWWSPTGTLSTLPLHAACPADGSPGALDRVVSSYTPTLRALRHARERAAGPADTGRLLVVAVADTEGLPPLPAAREEAEHLGRLLPGSTVLFDGSATHAAVVSALPGHAYAHFACHALGDLRRPSENRLVLHDHGERPLTVRDLARLRLPSVRLAYLSACDTLRTTPELADEAVHLVSAFQMAGFPHVVGSLWQVDDTIGARVAQQVYAALGGGGAGGRLDVAGTASALHAAVRALRADYPATPSLWACQVHLGP